MSQHLQVSIMVFINVAVLPCNILALVAAAQAKIKYRSNQTLLSEMGIIGAGLRLMFEVLVS